MCLMRMRLVPIIKTGCFSCRLDINWLLDYSVFLKHEKVCMFFAAASECVERAGPGQYYNPTVSYQT